MLLVFGVMFGVGLFVLREVGRALFCYRDLNGFVSTLSEQPPASVKLQLDRFADTLTDYNPLVRNASVAAMRAATREKFGADAVSWKKWWTAHRDGWQYHPSGQP